MTDDALRFGMRERDSVLQVSGERRDSAATWKRIPDECETDRWGHNRTCAVVDERPVKYEDARRRTDEMKWPAEKSAEHTA
jgi:hypothetical protein